MVDQNGNPLVLNQDSLLQSLNASDGGAADSLEDAEFVKFQDDKGQTTNKFPKIEVEKIQNNKMIQIAEQAQSSELMD